MDSSLKHSLLAEDEGISREQARYSQGSAFTSLLKLSVGPLIYQVGIAFHDAVDLYLISRALGPVSLQIVGFSTLMRFFGMSLAIFFGIALSGRLAKLIGEERREEAEQVIADIFRLAPPIELIAGIVFYFASIPMLKFMGCTEEIATKGRQYLTPILFSLPFISLFQLSVAFLQSEGRSILAGVMQLVAFILNCGCFGPLLLFGLKVDLKYAGFGFCLAQIVPGVILFILIFSGKFGLKPKWNLLGRRFCRETLSACLTGLPFILNVLMGTVPPLFMMSWMMKAAVKGGIPQFVGGTFSVFLKIQTIVQSFCVGFGQGFFVAGSNSRGVKNFMRHYELFKWALGITLIIQLIFLPILMAIPEKVAGVWISDAPTRAFSKTFVRIPFYTAFLVAVNEVVMNFLMSMGYAVTAMTPCIMRGVMFVLAGYLLYKSDDDNATKIMYTYNFNDGSVFLLDLIIVIFPLKKLFKDMREVTGTGTDGVMIA